LAKGAILQLCDLMALQGFQAEGYKQTAVTGAI
jgi:hypothetical protein